MRLLLCRDSRERPVLEEVLENEAAVALDEPESAKMKEKWPDRFVETRWALTRKEDPEEKDKKMTEVENQQEETAEKRYTNVN